MSSGDFTVRDRAILLCIALMWGSSFLFVQVGLEDFAPATVALLRVTLGALTLALFPSSRTALRHRGDWKLIVLLGLMWMAGPFIILPMAQQHIPSALAGMINGAAPLFTAAIAAAWFRQRLGQRLILGLGVGFAGVLAIGIPNVEGSASMTGILLVLLATVLYAGAFNISGVLQRRNGALPVIWRAQLVALVAIAPFGLPGLSDATPTAGGIVAMILLGGLGTGVAFALFAGLVGRVGAPKASVTNYLLPAIALGLGAGVLGERVAWMSVGGVVLVLAGAYLATTSRRARPGLVATPP